MGVSVAFVAAAACALLVTLRPAERAFWEDAKDRPGAVVFAATFFPALAAAFPRIEHRFGTVDCTPAPCRTVGAGPQVIEGTGLGAFLQQLALSTALDLAAGARGRRLNAEA